MLVFLAFARRSSGAAKTDIVVRIVSVVPVAVGRAAIVIIVVPRAAAQHSGVGNTRGKGRFF